MSKEETIDEVYKILVRNALDVSEHIKGFTKLMDFINQAIIDCKVLLKE